MRTVSVSCRFSANAEHTARGGASAQGEASTASMSVAVGTQHFYSLARRLHAQRADFYQGQALLNPLQPVVDAIETGVLVRDLATERGNVSP